MLNNPILFLATANPVESKRFYQSAIGLPFVSDTSFALTFDVYGTELRIAKVDRVFDAPYTVLGWAVDDIEATANELITNCVKFEVYDHVDQDTLGIWKSPDGAKVAWFKDPDNNTLSITQHQKE